MPSRAKPLITSIVALHFDEAAFLWSQREAAATAASYTLDDLAATDERVEAHIDGLRISGEAAWPVCEAGLDPQDLGTVFVCAVMAFESGDKQRMDQVVEVSNVSLASFEAAVAGIVWMDANRFNAIISSLVTAKSRRYRRLGIAACGYRRINPRGYLDQAVNSSDLFLRARALRAAGELKRADLLPLLKANLQHEDEACRFEAARSVCLLGDRSAVEILGSFVLALSPFTLSAMQVFLRVIDANTRRNWLKALSKIPERRREMLTGIGFTGDPAYVPGLIKQMEQPELARVSGGAFSLIAGVDLAAENLTTERPEGFEPGPNDDPEDENVEMDIDEELPWPDPNLVGQWWQRHHHHFIAGTRYLAGQAVSSANCHHVLRHGTQTQRYAAALELALSQAETPWFNTLAPGFRQKNTLGVES